MKLVSAVVLSLAMTAGCGKTEDAPAPPATTAATSAVTGAVAPAGAKPASSASAAGGAWRGAPPTSAAPSAAAPTAAAPSAGESFFAGDVPAGVKMKATKTFAIDPGILYLQGVEGWSGGQLPGYEYMAMSKDQGVVVRVATSTGVTSEMNCKNIATAAAMAPLKAKNLQETEPPQLRKVGKNKFVAREGVCSAEGPKGPLEIHFLNILRKNREDLWHYAVIIGFPKDASPEQRNEAMAWARSLEYNGGNGYSLP